MSHIDARERTFIRLKSSFTTRVFKGEPAVICLDGRTMDRVVRPRRSRAKYRMSNAVLHSRSVSPGKLATWEVLEWLFRCS